MNISVILNEDVPNLGRTGDVVKVRPGFARNYLLARKLAVEANPRNIRAFEHAKRLAMLKREHQKVAAATLKEKLEAIVLEMKARAGEEGKLFGSVTNLDLERALRERGFDVDRRKIVLPEPIKQLGEFTVPVKLEAEVEASLKVSVAAE
ncbi:MAG TPA: 50S ribosomal protein L9 [Candidatus Binataceae bacterium]|nr:50S ribosomal protein L9 [Candidatus Binataceae bacterium]